MQGGGNLVRWPNENTEHLLSSVSNGRYGVGQFNTTIAGYSTAIGTCLVPMAVIEDECF